MTIPQLTTEQLQAARAAATEARRRRADLKRQVRTGDISLSKALEVASEDDVLAHVKVVDLLKSIPGSAKSAPDSSWSGSISLRIDAFAGSAAIRWPA